MLRSMNTQLNYRISALDGDAGHLNDFLIDERTWMVRYAVIDLGKWLPGRKVLMARQGIAEADFASRTLTLNATKEQIENAPALIDDAPVSRQYEHYLYEHYRWAPYWAPGFAGGGIMPLETTASTDFESPPFKETNPNLRSLKELTGYAITIDGESVGRVDEFMCYDDTWEVPFLVADVGGWFHKERLMVPTRRVSDITFTAHTLALALDAEALEQMATYDPTAPEAGRLEMCVYDYHGKLFSHKALDKEPDR